MKKKVYACLLAGGKGTRLWPLSTKNYSKSFVSIGKREPLILGSINRLKGFVEKKNILIVVDKAQQKVLKKFTKQIPTQNIITEPFGRSTASAVGLAAINLNPDDIIVVLPTDALIKENGAFRKTLKEAVSFACENDVLICVGVAPKHASTAYGYIKIDKKIKGQINSIKRFIEKPNLKKAKKLMQNKKNLWNAGIFIFKAGDILSAMKKHSPLLWKELMKIKKNKSSKKSSYKRMKNVSIDYQVMEKAKNLYCIKGNFSWSDLGNWVSVGKLLKKDKNGNRTFGNIKLKGTKNSIIYNTTKEKIGLSDTKDSIFVVTENGILFCGKKDAERVKELAN